MVGNEICTDEDRGMRESIIQIGMERVLPLLNPFSSVRTICMSDGWQLGLAEISSGSCRSP